MKINSMTIKKIKCINGYTKEKMIEMINTRMLDHKSWNPSYSNCSYKAKDGNRCAVGVFIPDNHPGENFYENVVKLYHTYPELIKYMPLPLQYMYTLQSIHDAGAANEDKRPLLIDFINRNVE